MKICYLANAGSIHTQRWAEYFASKGHQIFIISFESGVVANSQVYLIPKVFPQRHLNILGNLPRIRRIVKRINPDILHAHYVTSYGLAGALTGQHPLILSAWGSDVLIMPEESQIYRQMVQFSMKRADLVTSIADHMTALMLKRHYAKPDKIITFPFGVDTNMFNPSGKKPVHDDKCIIVSNRRLDIGLDVDIFIRSIPQVLEYHPTTRFVVAGDGPLRSDLEDLAKSIGIGQAIEFVGAVEHRNMHTLLRNSDIFVSTSRTDGNNISLNEAMACGSFPIATDISANRNWVENRKNGLLFPCQDTTALSKCIIESISKPEWRNAVISKNWEIIQKRASWHKEMKKMNQIYHDLIASNKKYKN
ncbi:glycosyltransferase family 4 protein [Thermodesulfobacteriota bacterium]